MPVNIFRREGEEEQQNVYEDFAGTFKAGYQDEDGTPVSVSEFIVQTADPDLVDSLVEVLGGEVEELEEAKNDEIYRIRTTSNRVPIVLDDASGVYTSLVLWGADNSILHETDGTYTIEEGELTDQLSPFANEKTRDELKKAKFKPSIRVRFRIEGHEDLGRFAFYSQSWTALDDFAEAEAELAGIGGKATGELGLKEIQGKKFNFTKPFLKSVRAAADS